MKIVITCFLIFISGATLNSKGVNSVNKADSLLNVRIDSVAKIYKEEVSTLRMEVEALKKYQIKSEAYDQSFMEYGSWVVGIIIGLTILFGIIFNFTSDQIVEKKFKENYSYYLEKFKEVERTQEKCKDELDVIQTFSKTIRGIITAKDNSENKIKVKFPET